tara:strand:+ start:147012 stop:149237 length:2226 start_codon:yes stop_codon:yes gene_type:complete
MMGLSVLHPGLFIAGVLCVSIPIIVHLLRRKHRPISWGAMRFLEQAYKKRKRLVTLEQLLLLLSRCAIIALIAGAVAALIHGSGASDSRSRTLVLMLDNSIHSSTQLASGQSSLNQQRQRMLDLLNTLDTTRGDRAALITLASPAHGDAVPATSELGLIRSKLESIQGTDADRDLDGGLGLLSKLIESEDALQQLRVEPVLSLSSAGWDTETQYSLNAVEGVEKILIDVSESATDDNFAITDTVTLRPIVTKQAESADGTPIIQDEIQGVRITLSRSNPTTEQVSQVVLYDALTQEQLGSHTFQWSAGQAELSQSVFIDAKKLIPTRGGSAMLRVALNQTIPDNNPRDNARFVGMPIRQHISTGMIDQFSSGDASIRPSRWVRAVLGADDGLMTIQQIQATLASDRIDPTLDILFVLSPEAIDDAGWSRIARLNASGMPVVITPAVDPTSTDWISRIQTLAPGMLSGSIDSTSSTSRSFDPPIGLADTLPMTRDSAHNVLQGIENEYPDLASSVVITRRLNLQPGPDAQVLMMDSQQHPIALMLPAGASDAQDRPGAGGVVLFGVPFDVQWTDLPARPLFVAITHELVRSLLARSITPEMRTAGVNAAHLQFDNLEPLVEQSVDTRNGQHVSIYVMLDVQGAGTRGVIVNPDTQRTTIDPASSESPIEALTRNLDGIEITDLSDSTSLSEHALGSGTAEGRSLALILFAIAAVIGIVEFILARRCSYAANTPSAILPGGGL